MIEADVNLGYPNAVNFAMENTDADFVLCLNPDARAEPECLAELLAVDAAIAGAQIVSEDGLVRQAGANPLHPTGISPAGSFGLPREEGAPRETIVVSGACCLLRRETFLALGGFMREFFLYYDDADLGWRARIAGERVVYCPAAVVRHGYEFGRRERKMFFLERNRLISVLSNYEVRSLLVLAPLLLVFELGIAFVAAVQGWLPEKLRAYASVIELRSAIHAHRRRVQALRRRSDRELSGFFTARFDSPFMPAIPARVASALTAAYLRLV